MIAIACFYSLPSAKEQRDSHPIGNQLRPIYWDRHTLKYDYLVVVLGSESNFFGMPDVQENALTMKTLDDAIILRNHVLNILEQASLEHGNKDLRKSLLTFVQQRCPIIRS